MYTFMYYVYLLVTCFVLCRSAQIFVVLLMTLKHVCVNVGCNLARFIRSAEITIHMVLRFGKRFAFNWDKRDDDMMFFCFVLFCFVFLIKTKNTHHIIIMMMMI